MCLGLAENPIVQGESGILLGFTLTGHTLSNQRDTTKPAGLFGDTITAPAGAQTSIGDLTVSKSGESILFVPRGPQGDPLPISDIRSSDDVQVLQVVGTTNASTCTLTFGGRTTAPIPLQPLPPQTSFVWRATLPSAGSYTIGHAWADFWGWPAGTHGSTQALFQVFDSGKLVGSAIQDLSVLPGVNSNLASDVAVPGEGVFRQLGVFNFTGTNLEIRLSGPTDAGLLVAGMMRLVPVGDTAPEHVGFINPAQWFPAEKQGSLQNAASTARYGNWTLVYFYSAVGLGQQGYLGVPSGSVGTAFPAASDVQQALSALPNVLPGSLKVTSPSNQAISIQFSGLMGGKNWPTMACSDPAVGVIHDGTAGSSVGGDTPSVTINGVSHDLKAFSFAPGTSRIAFYLIQDAPAVQYRRYCESLYQNLNWYPLAAGIGYGGRVGYASQSGPLANWIFQGIAGPAEFQVDVTWPGGDPNGDLLECAILDGSGVALLTTSGIDQSKAPGDSVDAAGVRWKSVGRCTLPLQVNSLTVQARGVGTPGKHVILDSVRLTRVSPARGTKILPGDQVLFRMPADFVRTPSGSVAAVSGVPVTPASSTRLPAIPPTTKTMKLGYNCDYPIFWGSDSCYANMAVQVQQPIGLAQDAQGNPTKISVDIYAGGGSAATPITVPISDGGLGFGVPTCGGGVWMLQYTGSPWCSCRLETFDGLCNVDEITSRRVTNGNVNRIYYQVTSKTPASPSLQLRFRSTRQNSDGSFQCDVSGVAVYPPDVDPESPPRWRPSFLKKLRGVQCFRFMDMMATNELNLSKFAHLPDQANFPLGYSSQVISAPIATIGPPQPDAFAEAGSGTVVRVTTKVPHGLDTGFIVGLRTTDGTSLGQVLSNVVDPKTGATTATSRAPIDPTDGYRGQYGLNLCHVIDETTVQIGVDVFGGPLARMTNTLTPANAVIHAEVAPHARTGADDIADLCIASGLEPWVNVPWLATDDCVSRLAQVLARRLPAGRLIHVEYGNEPWNTAFVGNTYAVRMTKLLGQPDGGYVPYYMTRMGQVHKIFRDVWAALGRDPADVRRVCGVQQDYAAGTTAPCLDYAVAKGISFDELSPASYYNNAPAAGPVDDLLTREQLLDLFAMNVQQSDLPAHMAIHLQYCRDALAKNPAATWLSNVVLVNYEGGPGSITTPAMTANLAARNHGAHRHPDFAEIELHHLQMLEDAGVKLFNIFTLYGTRDLPQWGVYEGYQMEVGTGDATLDLANVNDFENLPAIKSETAAALMKWSAMLPQPTPPTPIPTPTPTPTPTPPAPPARVLHRNGTVRAYGMAAY